MTQDIDIVLPADRVDEFLSTASVSRFEVLSPPEVRWPKLMHRETRIDVDILPEGGRPGTALHPAPTTIPHPAEMGATREKLCYITFKSLVELKLAAGRPRDDADLIELIRENEHVLADVQSHLQGVHPHYVDRFAELVKLAHEPGADG